MTKKMAPNTGMINIEELGDPNAFSFLLMIVFRFLFLPLAVLSLSLASDWNSY
jgi:hypothetical protein